MYFSYLWAALVLNPREYGGSAVLLYAIKLKQSFHNNDLWDSQIVPF